MNLLPFIDIQLLKDTIAKFCPDSQLSQEERRRNSIGSVFCYRYDSNCTETIPAPVPNIGLTDIAACSSCAKVIDNPLSRGVPFKPQLLKGTVLPYPGFPTLNVLPIASVELVRVGLNCFGFASKYPNMILSLHRLPELPPLEVLAQTVVGRSVFVNWPMMHESRVVALSDEKQEIRLIKGQIKARKFSDQESDRWLAESIAMTQTYHIGNGSPGSGGLVMGEVKVRMRVLPLQGMKTNPASGSTKKLFGRQEADVPLQLALLQAPAPDPRFIERGPMTLVERYPVGSAVVLTKGKYRGCFGVVAGIADERNVAVKVQTLPAESPFGLAIARSVHESYISSADAARTLKMDGRVFGKITGRLQFEQDKYDLGLNLKASNGMCVVGYTRKKVIPLADKKQNKWMAGDTLLVIGSSDPDGGDDGGERIIWEYTPKAIRLIESYRQKFPQLFAALKKMPDEKKYDAQKVFGPNGESWLPLIRSWLDNHETAKIPRSPVTTDSMSYEAIAAVQKAADVRSLALKKAGYPKELLIKIPGNALYREGSTGATDVLLASDLNNNDSPRLGDRVVNLCADGVPFGARGTVVAIHEAATTGSVEVVMDEEFVGGNTLQGACSNFRGRLCRWAHLLKVEPDHADRLVEKMVPKGTGKAVVKKILTTMEREVNLEKSTPLKKEGNALSVAGVKPSGIVTTAATDVVSAKAQLDVNARDRAQSTGRGKQGVWKEARGPPKDGAGFATKGKRGSSATTGVTRWNALTQSLKTEAQLKSVLGIAPSTRACADSRPDAVDASASLKAALGIIPSDQASACMATPPPTSQTAADKLLQLLTKKQQPTQVMHTNTQPPTKPVSAFNFTYVIEGEEAKGGSFPPANNVPPNHQSTSYSMNLQSMPMPMPPFVGPQDANYQYSSSAPVLAPPVSLGLSNEQYPPLGAQASTQPKTTTQVQGHHAAHVAPQQAQFSMVPSHVAGKR